MEQDALVLYQPLHRREVGLAVGLARIQLSVNIKEQMLNKSWSDMEDMKYLSELQVMGHTPPQLTVALP